MGAAAVGAVGFPAQIGGERAGDSRRAVVVVCMYVCVCLSLSLSLSLCVRVRACDVLVTVTIEARFGCRSMSFQAPIAWFHP